MPRDYHAHFRLYRAGQISGLADKLEVAGVNSRRRDAPRQPKPHPYNSAQQHANPAAYHPVRSCENARPPPPQFFPRLLINGRRIFYPKLTQLIVQIL